MKKLSKFLFLAITIILLSSLHSFAQYTLTNFEIQNKQFPNGGSFLDNGQLHPQGVTNFTANFTFIKIPGSVNSFEIELVLLYQGTFTSISEKKFKGGTWDSGDVWTTTIDGKLSADSKGAVYLRYKVYTMNGSGSSTFVSSTNYPIGESGVAPVPGPNGTFTLYQYGQTLGGTYFSFNGSLDGVYYGDDYNAKYYGGAKVGYAFKTQAAGTKPVYLYYDVNVDHYYSMVNTTYPGYAQANAVAFYAYDTPQPNTVPLYGYLVWNENHFYTTTPGFAQDGYLYEGVVCYIPADQAPPTLPGSERWYRYFHAGTGDHYYTRSSGNYPGYVFEGSAGQVFSTQQPNTVPLYQYYNVAVNDHYYTTVNTSIPGYQQEGINCYVYPTMQNGTIPIYGYFNPSTGDHLYDRANQAPSGYNAEGVQFYIGS